jgi:hypothetical protein
MRFTLGITKKYIDRHPTASMTNNPLPGNHPRTPRVLSCEQQIIALSKVCNINKANVLRHKNVFLPSGNNTSTTLEVSITPPD